MKCPDGRSRSNQKIWENFDLSRLKFLAGTCVMVASMVMRAAQPSLNPDSQLGFFTNVASRLLSAQMDVDLTQIQIYPTNQYTPAVHRLLQLAANIYEATSTNSYPAVFRPLFSRDVGGLGSNLFISSFTNVAFVTGPTDSQLAIPVEAAALAETNIPVINLPVNVYGIPWIIGVRKGLPNFNKFDMESAFQLARKLQVTRPSTNSPISDYQYNQMFLLSLTNQLGVECWNSYRNDFTDPVAIYVTDSQSVMLTNDEGLNTGTTMVFYGSLHIPGGTNGSWPGYNPWVNPIGALASFQIPLNTATTVLPHSVYRFNIRGLPYLSTDLMLPYETNVEIAGNLYPQPHWSLTTSNDVRVVIMDTATSHYHIIDYVQLVGPDSDRDLTAEIISSYDFPADAAEASGTELWNTNLNFGFPVGIISQIGVSLGAYTPGAASGKWDQTNPILIANEIAGFSAFFGFAPPPPFGPGEAQAIAAAMSTTSIQAPFIPVATVVEHISWQANDPLVHYLASDLNWLGAVVNDRYADSLTNNNRNGTLGMPNQSYRPWGGNPLMPSFDPDPYNLGLKDPLVRNSDDWDFPTNESLSGNWLGRVHRGTPWQTIYLKSSDILQTIQIVGGVTNYTGTNKWTAWTGDTNISDSVAMAPVQDWHVASLLAHMLDNKPLQSLLSVNNPKPNGWFRVLNGLTALTNIVSDSQLAASAMAQFKALVIRPHSLQTALIANAIESLRAEQPGGVFHDVGDILEVPQVGVQSPFLNWNDSVQQQRGISDEAYEILPGQLLPLLRADSVGKVAPKNGQVIVQFSGYHNHAYAIEVSSNLIDWTTVATNFPMNGGFSFTNSAPSNTGPRFYRSLLVQ